MNDQNHDAKSITLNKAQSNGSCGHVTGTNIEGTNINFIILVVVITEM